MLVPTSRRCRGWMARTSTRMNCATSGSAIGCLFSAANSSIRSSSASRGGVSDSRYSACGRLRMASRRDFIVVRSPLTVVRGRTPRTTENGQRTTSFRFYRLAQFLGLEMRNQRLDDDVEVPFHDRRKIMRGEADAMIGHAIL